MNKMWQLDTGYAYRSAPKTLLNQSALKSTAYRNVNMANKSNFLI